MVCIVSVKCMCVYQLMFSPLFILHAVYVGRRIAYVKSPVEENKTHINILGTWEKYNDHSADVQYILWKIMKSLMNKYFLYKFKVYSLHLSAF